VIPLTIDAVSRIHSGAGRTSASRGRTDVQSTAPGEHRHFAPAHDVTQLITIGGDDTAFFGDEARRARRGRLRVVHVPKTIDKRSGSAATTSTPSGTRRRDTSASNIVKNHGLPRKTTSRWYYLIAMGRKADTWALGIGKAAGATWVTLVSRRNFRSRFDPGHRRFAGGRRHQAPDYGRSDGVAVHRRRRRSRTSRQRTSAAFTRV